MEDIIVTVKAAAEDTYRVYSALANLEHMFRSMEKRLGSDMSKALFGALADQLAYISNRLLDIYKLLQELLQDLEELKTKVKIVEAKKEEQE